jgi:hypothetical protein
LNALDTLIEKSDELRASIKQAGIVIESWKADPDRRSPIEVLHLAAISDDAATYHLAADAVIDRWRCGLVPRISARELVGLIESHYWLLDPQARSGGDGFRLKRRIKSLSRELIKTTPAS